MSKRLFLGIAVALAAAACGSGERALVSYTWIQEDGFSPDVLVVEFSDGTDPRRLTGADFVPAAGSRLDTAEFPTRTRGELVIQVWLIQGADTLSSGEVRLELRPDWRWSVSFFREEEDPSGRCFGCVGSATFELAPALRSAPGESLWVVWGGNWISDPVVY